MNPYNPTYLLKTIAPLMLLGLLMVIAACTDDDEFDDRTFGTDDFRVLKVSEGDNRLENGESGISASGLVLEVVFSHPVSQQAIASNLSVSGNPAYDIAYNENSSVATLTFETLNYESQYTVSLPAGTYGADGATLDEDFTLNFTTRALVVPEVSLSAQNASPEEGSSTLITATLSEVTTADVVVTLAFAGSAVLDEDFTVSDAVITVPGGELSASVTLDITDDTDTEGAETIEVSIANLANGTDDTPDLLTISIVDNDVLTDLELKGIFALRWATEPGSNSGKAIHLRATADIPDLSVYSIGVANNGGGTDSIEYTFPAMAVAAGEDILLAREDAALLTYFGSCSSEFEHVLQTDEMAQNGDDAIELYSGTAVIETYGDPDVDGTGMDWEYSGSWAYKAGDEWITGGIDCAASSTSTQDADCIYPLCAPALLFRGAMEIDTDGGLGIRAYHFKAFRDIPDLGAYKVEIYANGDGTSPFRVVDLPAGQSAAEGDDILMVRDSDVGDVGPYFGTCADRFTIYESTEITSNGDDALVFYANNVATDTLGVVGVDGTGQPWDYTNAFGYRSVPGEAFTFPGAECTNTATTNADASCSYPFCE
ncbi:Ig-like domain-containing protein [Roseivirga sp. BDSF3-8]|uniref:Ig-like domain-containing protein n=1 Tax=Roseivirga sp. BDSF3-8 TaxID=3241598 RepID=UPI003531888D